MNRLVEKVAIVTGAAMGIGRAIVLCFVGEGARVVVADVNQEAGQAVVEEIIGAGGQAIFVPCDVSHTAQVQTLVETTIQTYGGLDILVNNAGIAHVGTVVDTAEDDWDKVVSVNLKSIYLCSKYAIPHMISGQGGTVINIASVAGLVGLRQGAVYNASKGGVVLLTQNMALDFAEQGIRVNCICPGATVTPMYEAGLARAQDPESLRTRMTSLRPLGRLGRPQETAQAAVFLASQESSYITGATIVVDGGVMAQFAGQVRPGL